MKKRVSIFLLSLISITILLSVLVAAAPETSDLVTGFQDFFKPILEAIFGESTQIFEQLLFALIIVAFIYMALERVPIISDNAFALWTAAIASAILAVRFIATENLINLLLLPQGVLGVSLLTIIPFVVYFWFVEFGLSGAGSRVMRKIAWTVYGAVWAVLWYKQVYGTPGVEIEGEWAYLYLIVAVVSLILLLSDGTIQRAIRKSKGMTLSQEHRDDLVEDLRRKLKDELKREAEAETETDRERHANAVRRLQKRIDEMLKKY